MVEYAILSAQSTFASFGVLASSAEMWLGRLNWEVVGYTALGLVALWIATRAFRTR
jgi:hypothetical protein